MIHRALINDKRNPQYAYIAPTYGQAKRVAWEYVKEAVRDIPGVEINESELRVDIPRPHKRDKIRILLLSAEKPGSVKGIYLDGVLIDEYAECDPTIWTEAVRPALSDRMGWATFIGTPKGRNHFYDILQVAKRNPETWFYCIYKASETKIVADSELQAARTSMSDEEYNQEFECDFSAALVGAYYGKAMNEAENKGRVKEVPWDPALPVDTFWDLGIGDSTAIWFLQQIGQEYHWIDYIEESGISLPEYWKLMKEDERNRYYYRDLILPHDGAARELQTGKSRQQSLRQLTGINPIVLPRHAVEDRINASRMLIAKSWFDAVGCEKGIDALKNYERRWNAKEKRFEAKPRHNWASHGSDAFGLAAMGNKREPDRQKDYPRVADDMDYDILGA